MKGHPRCDIGRRGRRFLEPRPKVDRIERHSLPVRWGVTTVASKIDFFALPRPVQDRFAAATLRTAPPVPILAQPASRKRIWAYLGGSVVLAITAAIVLAVGCGDVHSALALHGPKLALIDAALLAGAAYGVLRAVGMLMAAEALPYRPGIYLFPACAVDAEEPDLKVWQVRDAERIETITESPPGLALWMPRGERFVIRASSPQVAERAHALLQKQRAKLIAALDDGDSHVLADLDPLYDRALSSPIGPTESLTPTQWVWRRFDWAIAAGVGVMLALVLVTTRNSISDDAMIRAVVTEGSPQ